MPAELSAQNNIFTEDFENPAQSLVRVPATNADLFRWSTSPQNYGGVNPNPQGMQFGAVDCNNLTAMRYQIARNTTLPPASPWATPPNPSTYSPGCFPDVSSHGVGGHLFLMGTYYSSNGTAGPGNKALVWQTKQHLLQGHTYQFKAQIGDLAYGDPIDGYESRFGVKVWGIPATGSPQLIQNVQTVGNSESLGYSAQGNLVCFTPDHDDDYLLGIEIVSNSYNWSQVYVPPPGTPRPQNPPVLNYFGLANIFLDEIRCGVPIPQMAQNSMTQCGSGPISFTILSPGGTSNVPLPSGAQYEWYTKSGNVRQNLLTGSSMVYTLAMPSGLAYGTPFNFFVDVVMNNGDRSQETPLQAIWYPEVQIPLIVSNYPILLVGHDVNLSVSQPQSGITYNWTGPGVPAPGSGNPITCNVPTVNSATYKATGVGTGGCNAESAPLTLPVLPLVVSDQVACAPVTITIQLAALSTTGYEYRWYSAATGGQRLTSSGTSYDALYNGPGIIGNRTIYVCIANSASGDESERLSVQLTWRPAPPDPTSGVFTPSPIVRGIPVSPTTYAPNNTDYTYMWDWNDGSAPSPPPHTYTSAGNYRVQLLVTDRSPQACAKPYYFDLKVTDLLCETYLPSQGVTLQQNPVNGAFTFTTACVPSAAAAQQPAYGEGRIVFDCVSGAPTPELSTLRREAVAASAQSLQPAVVPADAAYGVSAPGLASNPFLAGAGYLQAEAGYSWSAPITRGDNNRAGRFEPRPFAWELSRPNRMRAWVPAGRATRYTPNGDGVEETNALGTPSAVRVGYRSQALPYVTAQNATYASLVFESFETAYDKSTTAAFEDGTPIGQDVTSTTTGDVCAHAGRRSLLLAAGGQALPAAAGLPADWSRGGLRLLVWVRVAAGAGASTSAPALGSASWTGTGALPLYAEVVSAGSPSSTSSRVSLQLVGQSGEWSLCQVTLTGAFLRAAAATNPTSTTVRLGWSSSTAYTVWIDDVRLQPADAQATAYVYDPASLRLLASFDDQHFGLYYQYDTEGRLVRKIVETERGRKTVQETLYNTPKTAKLP